MTDVFKKIFQRVIYHTYYPSQQLSHKLKEGVRLRTELDKGLSLNSKLNFVLYPDNIIGGKHWWCFFASAVPLLKYYRYAYIYF